MWHTIAHSAFSVTSDDYMPNVDSTCEETQCAHVCQLFLCWQFMWENTHHVCVWLTSDTAIWNFGNHLTHMSNDESLQVWNGLIAYKAWKLPCTSSQISIQGRRNIRRNNNQGEMTHQTIKFHQGALDKSTHCSYKWQLLLFEGRHRQCMVVCDTVPKC